MIKVISWKPYFINQRQSDKIAVGSICFPGLFSLFSLDLPIAMKTKKK